MLYIRTQKDIIVLSEVSAAGSKATHVELDIHSGCAGLSFRSKDIVFEPFAQSSSSVSPQEVNPEIVGTIVHNIIAVPMFDSTGESIGVFELLNCDKAHFSSSTAKSILGKFAKYVSLLFYTNDLLKVNTLNKIVSSS
jgi:hypothetical protein